MYQIMSLENIYSRDINKVCLYDLSKPKTEHTQSPIEVVVRWCLNHHNNIDDSYCDVKCGQPQTGLGTERYITLCFALQN